ncbi:MAG TPA: nuclear transport factor 2 family protein [Sphingomicrobium sp.]|jgi:ketosteroid isomerase-like protein|nr:nuclear transport factor 2 family protein [Sphingomicrobium sp.]
MRASKKLLCVFLALLAGCHAHQPSSNARKDVDAIKAKYSSWKHAFEARDFRGIMAIYSPDVLAYGVVPPLQFNGADAYRQDYEAFLGRFKGPVRITIPHVHVEQSGAVAYAFGLEHLRGTTTSGKAVDMWLRFTDGWKRQDGQWLIEHEHLSVPIDMTTEKARLDLTP